MPGGLSETPPLYSNTILLWKTNKLQIEMKICIFYSGQRFPCGKNQAIEGDLEDLSIYPATLFFKCACIYMEYKS